MFVDICIPDLVWDLLRSRSNSMAVLIKYSLGHSPVAMTCSSGRLPTAEPIESKLVNMQWPNDNIVAPPVNRK